MFSSLTHQSFLKASFFACLTSYASSSPLDIPSTLIDLPLPALIESRQSSGPAPPINFGSENVILTDENGKNWTFQHYSGVDINGNPADMSIILDLSPPLVAEWQGNSTSVCAAANLTRKLTRRTQPQIGPDGSIILTTDDWENIDIDECARATVFVGVGRALANGAYYIVPLTEQAKKLAVIRDAGFNSLVRDIWSYFDGAPELEWVCQTFACLGSSRSSTCSTPEYLNCPCTPSAFSSTPQTFDKLAIVAQNQAIASDSKTPLDGITAVCNGLGTKLWTTRDNMINGVNNFCKFGVIYNGRYWDQGDPLLSQIMISSQYASNPQTFRISPDQCTQLLTRVVDDCDGNSPDNPHNFKHGGSIGYLGLNLSIELTQAAYQDPYCNNRFNPTQWVDRDVAVAAVTDLCNTPGLLTGKSGARFQTLANQGKNTEVMVSILFTQNAPMSMDECVRETSVPIDGCDGNDPTTNPDGNKYGGLYVTDNGAVINVTPQVTPPVFPPNELDVNGHPIVPVCSLQPATHVSRASINTAINNFCVTGNSLGVGSLKSGSSYVHVGGRALTPADADGAYQQGSTVCRHHDGWQGNIIAEDCNFAMNAMLDKCDISILTVELFYDYRCVRWTIDASTTA
ncbi:hypothetical protein N431DRAFT_527367 [Stipitochalara longipes BDJ]|nr:hypothetical protein N431DRAFT_527367 [Stipitochalara longipes BDJ]